MRKLRDERDLNFFMSRLQQNIIYAGIVIAVIGFFWAVVPKKQYESQGVYLPQTTEIYSTVDAKIVQFYASESMNLRKAVPVVTGFNESPIGIIRVDTHYTSKKEIQSSCEQNVQKAKMLAAQHGVTKVIGNCVVSGNTGPLDGANLYAYAYH
ncbi:Francisella virulence factor A [Fastidiosibacter lacustris]|uniref:Francisella virulence factor A n=1 Tax=Fastidiosibacter lacustris TaxID=2056695 RepID=UPI000E340703|nr:hypothetical protein [Fastidiosibacter lacustris]